MILRSVEKVVGPSVCRAFICSALESVEQYQAVDRVEVVTLELSRVQPLSRHAVQRRIDRGHKLLESSFAAGVVPFELMTYECDGEPVRLVFPPVVERHSEGTFVVDGVHRFLAALAAGLDKVKCVRVEGEYLPALPCLPTMWADVMVEEDQRGLGEILPDLNLNLFRHLTSFFNSERFEFADRLSALRYVEDNGRLMPGKGKKDERS